MHRRVSSSAAILSTRILTAATLLALLLAAGCKTSSDAAAAATEMAATAKSLSDYYSALKTVLSNTDQIYTLNQTLYSKPYSTQSQLELKQTQEELARRITMADDLSTLADSFAKLTKSTAPADVATAGNKLEAEVDTLASVKASSAEQSAVRSALTDLVKAVQARKEREAAQAMDSLATNLSALFEKESATWKSVDDVYVQLAGTLANNLADQNLIDSSAMLKPALDPFQLFPIPSPDLAAKLAPLEKQQIAARQAELLKSYADATDAMAKSLKEMAERIHLVATDKPMPFRLPPLSLATVEKWANAAMSN